MPRLMNFYGIFLEEFDTLWESKSDANIYYGENIEEISIDIRKVLEELAKKNNYILTESGLFYLVAQFTYYLGRSNNFCDAVEHFQAILAKIGMIKRKNYKILKIRDEYVYSCNRVWVRKEVKKKDLIKK